MSAEHPEQQTPGWKKLLARITSLVKQVGRHAWQYVKTIVDYYRSRKREIKEHLIEYVNGLQPPEIRRREIRIHEYEEKPSAEFTDDGWRIDLPDCCIKCGELENTKRVSRSLDVEDLTWPVRSPVIGLLISMPVAFFSGSAWFLPLGFLAGFPIGYHLRKFVSVRLRFNRCTAHADSRNYPKLRRFGDQIIILTGHKSVPLRFRNQEYAKPGELLGSYIEEQSADFEPPKIQMAESSDVTFIQHDEPLGIPLDEPDDAPPTLPLAENEPGKNGDDDGLPLI